MRTFMEDRTVPAHQLAVILPANTVFSSDIDVVVNSAGQLLGTLAVSKGSIDWVPRGSQSRWRLGWERFDELMQVHGRQVRKPTSPRRGSPRRRAAATARRRG
jgi:hypothetical protein